jgi:hypothetical protein
MIPRALANAPSTISRTAQSISRAVSSLYVRSRNPPGLPPRKPVGSVS